MTRNPKSRCIPAVLAAAALFAPAPASASEPSAVCDAFFTNVESKFEGANRVFRALDSLNDVMSCLDGDVLVCLNDAGDDALVLEARDYLAVELPSDAGLERLDGHWEVNGKRLAVCSQSPWHPPGIDVKTQFGTAGVALFNAAWDADSTPVPGTHTFMESRGTGVLLESSSLDLTGLEAPADGVVRSLLRQHSTDTSGSLVSPQVWADDLQVLGETDQGAVLVRHTGQSDSGADCTVNGTVMLSGVSWSGLGSDSALYRSDCVNGEGADCDSPPGDSSTVSVTVAASAVEGDGTPVLSAPLARVEGTLAVSDTVVVGLDFLGSSVFASRDQLTLGAGSSLSGLDAYELDPRPAVLSSDEADVVATEVYLGDLVGWGTVVSGRTVAMGGAYLCGLDVQSLLSAGATPDGVAELVNSAVLGSRFSKAVGVALPGASVRAANVLFAGTSDDGTAPTPLVHGGASLVVTNLLGFESRMVAGTDESDTRDGTVRLWANEAEHEDCAAWGLSTGCETLEDEPVFTADPDVLLQTDCSGVSPGLQDLLAAEAQGGAGDALLADALPVLPVLSEDQTALVGAGQTWTKTTVRRVRPCRRRLLDVGAYGACSLSFLAPVSAEEPVEPGDSGALDTALPGTDGADEARGLLAAGCRYGSLGGVLLVPLGGAARRRRRR